MDALHPSEETGVASGEANLGKLQREFITLIRSAYAAKTADDFGVTSVVISHDMASTFRIGDRISMLSEGKILVSGTPPELLQSAHPALREFIETAGLAGPLTPHQPGATS